MISYKEIKMVVLDHLSEIQLVPENGTSAEQVVTSPDVGSDLLMQ